MANPAPTINQINAFNATQGTTIDFNIIGGTELVRSNRIYIYDLSDNSLICTHLYVSTESIHELPPNTDGSIVYESGKSSADFVNGAQYYAQIQTFTDIAGTEGGSGLSVAKMFWCLVDPTLTITTIPSTISTTSYNVSATYNANTSVVSNIIQQYQFNLYNATGSLLQSSGVIVGNGEQQGTSTAYDISYNFTGLSVGSSYYVTVEVTTTQGMNVSVQSNTFTVSIDTPTLGEATVVNNSCDGYISVTSNLSSEYGGSGSGEIVSFETDSENVFTKLQVDLDPIQDLNGYDAPWVGGAGKNKFYFSAIQQSNPRGLTYTRTENEITISGTTTGVSDAYFWDAMDGYDGLYLPNGTYTITATGLTGSMKCVFSGSGRNGVQYSELLPSYPSKTVTITDGTQPFSYFVIRTTSTGETVNTKVKLQIESGSSATSWTPYENICPISGHDSVDVEHTGKNLLDSSSFVQGSIYSDTGIEYYVTTRVRSPYIRLLAGQYTISSANGFDSIVYVFDENKQLMQSESFMSWQSSPHTYSISGTRFIRVIFRKTDNSVITPSELTGEQLELGTTATAYEPYTEQTYHQDIEATYTPTVQDNTPYLFKQTGDVGGDRETIELVGGTVAWNQLIPNPTSPTTDTSMIVFNSGTRIVKGHRYIVAFNGKKTDESGSNVNAFWYVNENGENNPYSIAIGATRIITPTQTSTSNGSYNGNNNTWFYISNVSNATIYSFMCIDLTAMFGSTIADYIYSLEQATAGAGVAYFRKLFPKAYYPYNAGELISVKTSSHDTVGKNRLDVGNLVQGNFFVPAPSNLNNVSYDGYIPLESGQQYTWSAVVPQSGGRYIRFYDSAKAELTSERINNYSSDAKITFTMPNNAKYICIMWFSNVQILVADCSQSQLEFGSTATDYEPYVENTYPLDADLELRGMLKLDTSNNLYYDGDVYESDGTVTRKYGIVDLGTLTWTYNDTRFCSSSLRSTAKRQQAWDVPNPMAICSPYPYGAVNAGGNDKKMGFYDGYLYVNDSTYTSATDFKTAMSGVYLVYELATPTTETADAFEEIQKVTPIYGTEEFADSRTVPIPVYTKTQYLTRDIYGGYIDFVNGLLVVDRKTVTLNGTENIQSTSNNRFYVNYADAVEVNASNQTTYKGVMCDRLASDTWAGLLYNSGVCGPVWGRGISFRLDSITTVNDWKTYFANNPTQFCYELAEPMIFQLTPQQIQTLVGKNNVWSEQGEISLAYHIPITNLLVKRQDVDDVSGSWLTLYSQPITQASDMDFTFIDFTNQYGKTYKYALVPLLTQTQSGVEVEVEGGYTVSDEVQSVFDGVFIVDSTGSQKCKANVGYGNVDMNQTVGTITPIGAKYPVVITNSKNQYHNGSISGTIVPDDYYFNGNLSRIDMVNKRDELEQFLTNKRAKIIKDWNGKIWLVMIMDNVSCTFNNNYGMGIVNFSTSWVEVGDPTNQQDLQATGLINVGGV